MPTLYDYGLEAYSPLEAIYRDNEIAEWVNRKKNHRTPRKLSKAFGEKNEPIYGNEWCEPDDHTGSYLTTAERRKEKMANGWSECPLDNECVPKTQKKRKIEKRQWFHSRTPFPPSTRASRYSYASEIAYRRYKDFEKDGQKKIKSGKYYQAADLFLKAAKAREEFHKRFKKANEGHKAKINSLKGNYWNIHKWVETNKLEDNIVNEYNRNHSKKRKYSPFWARCIQSLRRERDYDGPRAAEPCYYVFERLMVMHKKLIKSKKN